MANLNSNELNVLKACVTDSVQYSPDEDHGFMTEDVHVEGLSKKQIEGYLGALAAKELILTSDDYYFSGFMTKKGLEVLGIPIG